MLAALFAPAYTVEIRPESWPGDVQAQEGVQLAEEGVHVSAPDTSIKLQTGPVALKPGAYVAEDTAGNRLPLSTSENSLLVLTVPGGYSGAVSVSYREPVLWRIAELISLATVVGLCIGCARGRRKKASQQLAGDLPGKIG